jgi:hypothetical protein
MGAALELLSGYVTAPGATLTGLTMGAGNSNTVRNAPLDRKISLLQCWAMSQGAGILRVRSPKMHDNVQGVRLGVAAANGEPLLPWGVKQELFAQDQLTLELSGSAVAGDIEMAGFLVHYEELPGVSARFAKLEDIKGKVKNIFTVENTLALGTAGGYSGEEAINAEFDLLKANTDYALLGYLVSANAGCVRWRGADVGNLGVGGPAIAGRRAITERWFVKLSQVFDLALIPIFNAANKAGILVDGMQDENGTDITVTSIFAELGGG